MRSHEKEGDGYKPICVGLAVLDLSKLLMYDFHFQSKSNPVIDLSYCLQILIHCQYEIKTEDIYADMKKDNELYDFSDYPKDHPLYSDANQKVIGKFKEKHHQQLLQSSSV